MPAPVEQAGVSGALIALRAAGLTVLAFTVAMALVVRFAPMRQERWHVDPDLAQKQPGQNDYLLRAFGTALDGADGIAGLYEGDAESLTYYIEQVALAEPRTKVIAGDALLGYITLVQRSKWLGFPDAITVMAHDIGPDRATLSIWSRSRYGERDFGVNRARVSRWLADIQPLLIDPLAAPAP